MCEQERESVGESDRETATTSRYKGMLPVASDYPQVKSIWFRRSHLTESVYNVVLQKSIPAQIRQLILYLTINDLKNSLTNL